MSDSLTLVHRGITLARDHGSEGPGQTFRAGINGAELVVHFTPLARIRYVAELSAPVEGRSIVNISRVSARTIDELETLLREAVLSEAGADALVMLSAKRRAA